MDRFPKDCWTKDCPHFHVWDMSVDDLCCACDVLDKECDACDGRMPVKVTVVYLGKLRMQLRH